MCSLHIPWLIICSIGVPTLMLRHENKSKTTWLGAYDKVKIGMRRAEVYAILGKPADYRIDKRGLDFTEFLPAMVIALNSELWISEFVLIRASFDRDKVIWTNATIRPRPNLNLESQDWRRRRGKKGTQLFSP